MSRQGSATAGFVAVIRPPEMREHIVEPKVEVVGPSQEPADQPQKEQAQIGESHSHTENVRESRVSLQLQTTPEKTHAEALQTNSDKKTSHSPLFQESPAGCGCSKSGCLKLYCNCFSKGALCSKNCLCHGCKNSTDNLERSEAINQIILRDDMAFSRRILGDDTDGGCNCRKSNCNKKYCECYRKGRRCIERCTCFDCKNMKEGHLKTEERVLEKEETFRKTFDLLLKKKIKLG